MSFKPSAKGCNQPHKPTTFGPILRCIDAIPFLSAKVKNAIQSITGTIVDSQ